MNDITSQPVSPQKNTKPVFVSVIVILIIAGIAAIYFFQTSMAPTPESAYTEEFNKGDDLLHHDGQGPLAIPYFQNALKMSTSAGEEARAKLHLGTAQLRSSNPFEGIITLKEVSLNDLYPDTTRAAAVHHTMEYLLANQKLENADFIFQGETWGDMRHPPENVKPVQAAYEWASAELYPIYQVEYWLAMRYSRLAHRVAGEELRYSNLALTHIAQGDDHYRHAKDTSHLMQQVWSLFNKGLALSSLYELGFAQAEEVEDVFSSARALAEEDSSGEMVSLRENLKLFGRMYHARFLAKLDPVPIDRILQLIEPLSQNPTEHVNAWMKGKRTKATKKNNERDGLVALSKLDPRLKDKLVSLGWTEDDFNR